MLGVAWAARPVPTRHSLGPHHEAQGTRGDCDD